MPNPERGEFPIRLGGEERTLRYSFNAWVEFEQKTALKPHELIGKELTLAEIRALLWAGLLHDDPKLTEPEVGDMLDPETINETLVDIFAAVGLSFEIVEDSDPNPKREPKTKKAGTGKRSRK